MNAFGKLPPMNGVILLTCILQISVGIFIAVVPTPYPMFDRVVKISAAAVALIVLIDWLKKSNKKPKYPAVSVFNNEKLLACCVPAAVNYALLPGGKGQLEFTSLNFSASPFGFVSTDHGIRICAYHEARRENNSISLESYEELYQRGLNHAGMEAHCILQYAQDGKPMGHIHMVPLSARTAARVANGELGVDDFPARYISRDMNHDALLVVSAVQYNDKNSQLNPALVYQAIVYHINQFLKDKDSLVLIFPAPNQKCRNLLIAHGFEGGKYSAEGYELFMIELVNVAILPQVVSMALCA